MIDTSDDNCAMTLYYTAYQVKGKRSLTARAGPTHRLVMAVNSRSCPAGGNPRFQSNYPSGVSFKTLCGIDLALSEFSVILRTGMVPDCLRCRKSAEKRENRNDFLWR